MEKVIGLLNLHCDRDLGALTAKRSIASTSFLGRYAFLDFPLSNFANSDIDVVGILVRDSLRSLIRHLGSGHSFMDNTKLGSITMLYDEPYAHNLGYNNDINNLLENKWFLDNSSATTVVIAPSSMICSIDYRPYIEKHLQSGSRISMIYAPNQDTKNHFIDCDLLSFDSTGRVQSITRNRGNTEKGDVFLNMIIIEKEMLNSLIQYASKTSSFFTLRDTLAYVCKEIKIFSIPCDNLVYYFDSLSSYLNQSLDLLNPQNFNKLFVPHWPIYTKTYDTPPVIYGDKSEVKNSFIANGAHIEGKVINSIIGRDVYIKEGAEIRNSIIFSKGIVFENTFLDHVICDKEAQILYSKKLVGKEDEPFFIRRENIV